MDDAVLVHISHAFANLPHEENAVLFSEREIVCHDSFEEFSTGYAKQIIKIINRSCNGPIFSYLRILLQQYKGNGLSRF